MLLLKSSKQQKSKDKYNQRVGVEPEVIIQRCHTRVLEYCPPPEARHMLVAPPRALGLQTQKVVFLDRYFFGDRGFCFRNMLVVAPRESPALSVQQLMACSSERSVCSEFRAHSC